MKGLEQVRIERFKIFLVLICAGLITACACPRSFIQPQPVPEIRPGMLAGYLPENQHPNSFFLLPPPPTPGSLAFALDEKVNRDSLALRGAPRWALAIQDANLRFPHAPNAFSCALKVPITETDAPRLCILLRRTLTDAILSTQPAKKYYRRTRPFVMNNELTCTPEMETILMADGSYPSGHAAIGWAWALILTEISPGQADEILARGRAFGQSRVVCNMHWESDVAAGRFVAACLVARLHADAAFRADVDAAKAELAVVRAKGLKPARDCAAETAVMAK